MKYYLRALSLMLAISFALVWHVLPVFASPHYDLAPNPFAEAYLLESLRIYGEADFEVFSEAERNISGKALIDALKDSQVQTHSFLYIANVTVVDGIYANDSVIPVNVQFENVNFSSDVDLNSSLLHAVWIDNSTFQSYLNFNLATFDGNVGMQGNTFEQVSFGRAMINGGVDLRSNTFNMGVDFNGAHITEELLLDDSQFTGIHPMPESSYVAEFWTTIVDGRASFINTYFAGKAYFEQSEFYRLDMRGAVFDQEMVLEGSRVERSADFTNATFGGLANFKDFSAENTVKFTGVTFNGEAIFENATFTHDVIFKDASFKGAANFKYITVGRFCEFTNTKFNNDFLFEYTSVAWPYFENVVFNGKVTFEGMHASEDFEIMGASYNYAQEPFKANLMKVDDTVKITDFTAPAGIDLCNGHFGNLIISNKDKSEIAFIKIIATDIDGQLTIERVNMQSFFGTGTSITKSTTLNQVSITKQLNMSNASIGFLKIDAQPKWPTNPNDFKLRGMTYTDIDLGDQELTKETWQGVLELINQASYSPQAYQSFSQFLTDKGHPDWAAQVNLKQKRRERDEALRHFSGAWFWSWFLDIFAGYGHRPVFAFIWSGLVITIGALVFRRKENMLPVDQADAKVEYNPVWYSFALFLPYIDLGIASKWEPDPCRKWARNYKYVHMMLGWVLAPIALLTFSGIIG